MYFSRTVKLSLALTGFFALNSVMARPATAQNLTYTLTDMTFSDGAVASGYFDYNPQTQTFGSYDVTTTNGVTDALTGYRYTSTTSTPDHTDNFEFDFSSLFPNKFVSFDAISEITSPGSYSLFFGSNITTHHFEGSGEFTPDARGIETGFLLVTGPAAVPEVSTTVSFGLLLVLGLGGAAIAVRKKKALAQD